MSEPNSSPVSFPPGSYDFDALKSGLDKAAKGAAKNYEDAVGAVLRDTAENSFKPADPSAQEGYKTVPVQNALGGTENIQVYDPKLGAKIEDQPADGKPDAAELQTRQAETTAAAVDVAASAPAPKE